MAAAKDDVRTWFRHAILPASLTLSRTDLAPGALGRLPDKLSKRGETARPQIDLRSQETEHVARCLPRERRRRPAALKHPRKPTR